MRVGNIIPCVCCEEPLWSMNGYAGMPVIRTYGGVDRYFEAICPKCGRGGFIQYTSVYLALKAWNEMQEGLRYPDIWEVMDGRQSNEHLD